jgi:hypothetical protein
VEFPFSTPSLTHSNRALLETQDGLRNAVLGALIASYVKFTSESEQKFVLRKVCTTLAAFFLHSNTSWQFPVRHILASLCDGRLIEYEKVGDFQKTWSGLQNVTSQKLCSALWLSSSLVEEVTKSDLGGVERSVS